MSRAPTEKTSLTGGSANGSASNGESGAAKAWKSFTGLFSRARAATGGYNAVDGADSSAPVQPTAPSGYGTTSTGGGFAPGGPGGSSNGH